MNQSSQDAHTFWSNFVSDVGAVAKSLSARARTVGALASGLVQTVERGETFDPTSERYLTLSNQPPAVGDAIAFLPTAEGSGYVLGAFQGSGITKEALFSVDQASSGLGADTGSNTLTGTYVSLFHLDFTGLPAGTYTSSSLSSAVFWHSVAGGTIGLHTIILVNGVTVQTGTVKLPSAGNAANEMIRLSIGNTFTGITVPEGATVTVQSEYRPNTAGTANARQADMYARLTRTGA